MTRRDPVAIVLEPPVRRVRERDGAGAGLAEQIHQHGFARVRPVAHEFRRLLEADPAELPQTHGKSGREGDHERVEGVQIARAAVHERQIELLVRFEEPDRLERGHLSHAVHDRRGIEPP